MIINKMCIYFLFFTVLRELWLIQHQISCDQFRTLRLHAVHKMRSIASDVARTVVCLSVCL